MSAPAMPEWAQMTTSITRQVGEWRVHVRRDGHRMVSNATMRSNRMAVGDQCDHLPEVEAAQSQIDAELHNAWLGSANERAARMGARVSMRLETWTVSRLVMEGQALITREVEIPVWVAVLHLPDGEEVYRMVTDHRGRSPWQGDPTTFRRRGGVVEMISLSGRLAGTEVWTDVSGWMSCIRPEWIADAEVAR
jgi:hypothetical protein